MSKHSADKEENKSAEATTEVTEATEATEATEDSEELLGADDSPPVDSAFGEITSEQAVEKLEQFELASENAKDDLLRVQAEMQNLRRRTQQDVEKAHKYGQEKFAIELLGVVDNLERALAADGANDESDEGASTVNEGEKIKAIYEGVELTLKSFADCFSKFSIEVVEPHGEPFDPELHQAMSIQENAEVEPNTVIAVMQKGYTLHGRVIRPAMVIVAKAPVESADDDS
ncbi:MAG: nucleotide exchange factor GrpE [Proteobacteria bacterium]|nr:nucleotide exchange factor GrpE [Pseudomonadota bacterium]